MTSRSRVASEGSRPKGWNMSLAVPAPKSRHNAFFALERSLPTEEAIVVVTNCLADDEFKEWAPRVVGKWHGLSA
jgi:hypothetical protein